VDLIVISMGSSVGMHAPFWGPRPHLFADVNAKKTHVGSRDKVRPRTCTYWGLDSRQKLASRVQSKAWCSDVILKTPILSQNKYCSFPSFGLNRHRCVIEHCIRCTHDYKILRSTRITCIRACRITNTHQTWIITVAAA
jgi:hypothetical protein